MRGAGRMHRQAAHVADVDQVVEHLQRLDEFSSGGAAADQLEAHQTAVAAAEIGIGAALGLAFHEAGEDDLGHRFVPGQVVGHLGGVGGMLAHAQRQGFQSLDELEGVVGAHGSAQVAQQRHPRLDDVGDGPQRLDRFRPDRAVVAGIGRVEHGEALGVGLPVEVAAIDDDAADRGAVAADVFGGGMHDDGGAVVEGPAQHRCRGVVHDQRDAQLAAGLGHLLDGEDLELGIGQGLGVDRPGLLVGRLGEVLGIGGVDEAHLDAHGAERVGKQVPGAAVEIGRADDVVAGVGDILDGDHAGRLARAHRQGRDAAFQRRHAVFQHGAGRVHDAAVDVAQLLQGEKVAGVLGVAELIGRGLVDGYRDGARFGVETVPGMQHHGLGICEIVSHVEDSPEICLCGPLMVSPRLEFRVGPSIQAWAGGGQAWRLAAPGELG